MATAFNTSLVLSYNMARYGATVNDSVVYNEPEDLVYQVTQVFGKQYCSSPEIGSRWNADHSLFALWFGINELAFPILRPLRSPLTDVDSAAFNSATSRMIHTVKYPGF